MLKNLRRALLFVFRSTCAIKKLNYEKASVYIIRHSTNSSKMVRVLNVAEKNDAAKSIAEIMCNGRFRRREGRSVYNKIYEFEYNLFNQRCQMVMTSVSGHLLNLEFAGSYRKWQWCNP
ncbi:DNA topoisomerase 3-alpha, partial [Stegodyphus mimosarum]